MNEHELWNELGNLYFLSGAYDQAVQAYNKAIQIDGSFGKAYSNLAYVYAQQEKYQFAVPLFKKSLELLKDDKQKAETWNRLGHVYRSLKQYQESVSAYQCADELQTATTRNNGQPAAETSKNTTKTEDIAYQVVEEQQDYQYMNVEYLYDTELETKGFPVESVLVEAEMVVPTTQNNRHSPVQPANRGVELPASKPIIEFAEEVRAEPISGNKTIDENPQAETEASPSDLPTAVPYTDENKKQMALHTVDEEVVQDFPNTEEAPDSGLEELVLPAQEVDLPVEEIWPVNDSITEDLVNQSEEADHQISNETMLIDSETVASPDEKLQETELGYEELIAQTPQRNTDVLSDELELEVPQTKSLLWEIETDSEPENDVIPDESVQKVEEIYEMEERGSHLPVSVPVEQKSQQNLNGRSETTGTEICIEEEKLAKQIEINPRSATTWESLGTLYKTAGRYKEAIHAFKKAISIAPREVSFYHNLGLVYAAQGISQEAFDTFQKVLELDPNHSLTHASLGGYYKKMGLDELAQKHIGKAMKQIYESENEYNRACLDAICGNVDRAIELLRVALENKQTYVDWVINDPDLDPLRKDDRFKQLIADFSK